MNRSSSLFYSNTKSVKNSKPTKNCIQINFNTKSKVKKSNESTVNSSRIDILNTTRKQSFFKLSNKTMCSKPYNLNINSLNNFMTNNEFYFDLKKWQENRSAKTILKNNTKNEYLNNSIIIQKLRFLELFGNSEFKEFNFNLNFFDQLSSFKHLLKLTEVVSDEMKSQSFVPN